MLYNTKIKFKMKRTIQYYTLVVILSTNIRNYKIIVRFNIRVIH